MREIMRMSKIMRVEKIGQFLREISLSWFQHVERINIERFLVKAMKFGALSEQMCKNRRDGDGAENTGQSPQAGTV